MFCRQSKQTSTTLKPDTHWGDKVEFKTVDFVESWQSRPCCFGPVQTGDKVDRTFNIRATKSTKLATMLTPTSCGIQVVADLLPKPATKSTVSGTISTVGLYGDSRLCCPLVAGFGNNRLWTKSTVLNSTLSPVCTGLKTCQAFIT